MEIEMPATILVEVKKKKKSHCDKAGVTINSLYMKYARKCPQ